MEKNSSTVQPKNKTPRVRVLPEELSNKIAAGEVVERPASVVKELVENALDAKATHITVRIVAAGRRTIEVVDNGHGMSENDALLSIERHATSKIRKAEDLDCIATLGFRGEALASIAAVSRFEMVTRRKDDESATRIRVDGGVLRDVSEIGASVGTRITANRLYFNTPVRAKFLKGITTELSHCIDIVQRHALAEEGVGFLFLHNDKVLIDIPQNAILRERVALLWGLNFVNDMVEFEGEQAGFKIKGIIGTPALNKPKRSHQFFFMNHRPVVNRSIQYGFEDGYRGLLTIGRHPAGVLMIETHPRFVDVNIHPTKREIRFRDERAARDAVRDIVRERLSRIEIASAPVFAPPPSQNDQIEVIQVSEPESTDKIEPVPISVSTSDSAIWEEPTAPAQVEQTEIPGTESSEKITGIEPAGMYKPIEEIGNAPLQIFDTYLLVPDGDRLLIIDQHALHERLNFDSLMEELADSYYAAQQLAVPILVDVPPSHAKLLESNVALFSKLGIEIESFGPTTFQVTSICHLYEDSSIPDAICRVLDELAQGDLFDKEGFVADLLRLTIESCRASVKAGDRLSQEERLALLEGFRRLQPPYTCPHGRPIITELTQVQMEKSFRRRQ